MFSHIFSLFDHNSWTNYPIKLKFELDLYCMILNNCAKIEYNPKTGSITRCSGRVSMICSARGTIYCSKSGNVWWLSCPFLILFICVFVVGCLSNDWWFTFPDFEQYMVPRAEQIMLTLPEHLVILPVFVGVHTASALFCLWCSCSIPFICFVQQLFLNRTSTFCNLW
jgi:hypothetical protein